MCSSACQILNLKMYHTREGKTKRTLKKRVKENNVLVYKPSFVFLFFQYLSVIFVVTGNTWHQDNILSNLFGRYLVISSQVGYVITIIFTLGPIPSTSLFVTSSLLCVIEFTSSVENTYKKHFLQKLGKNRS